MGPRLMNEKVAPAKVVCCSVLLSFFSTHSPVAQFSLFTYFLFPPLPLTEGRWRESGKEIFCCQGIVTSKLNLALLVNTIYKFSQQLTQNCPQTFKGTTFFKLKFVRLSFRTYVCQGRKGLSWPEESPLKIQLVKPGAHITKVVIPSLKKRVLI